MRRAIAFAVVGVVAAHGGVVAAAPKGGAGAKASPAPAAGAAPTKADAAPEPATQAAGDKRRIVGILDVRVEGVPKEIAAQFQTDLEKQLDSRAYWLSPWARLHEVMSNSTKWTEGCLVGSCLLEVKRQSGAELVLLAALTGSGTSFGYVVTLVRTDTGRVLAQEAERCDVCTVNEVLTNATLSAVRLLTGVPDQLPDDSAEQGAAIAVATEKVRLRHRAQRARRDRVGLVTLLGGAALATAGFTIYLVGDRPGYGLAAGAAGTGLALGGVVALTF